MLAQILSGCTSHLVFVFISARKLSPVHFYPKSFGLDRRPAPLRTENFGQPKAINNKGAPYRVLKTIRVGSGPTGAFCFLIIIFILEKPN